MLPWKEFQVRRAFSGNLVQQELRGRKEILVILDRKASRGFKGHKESKVFRGLPEPLVLAIR